MRQPSDDYSIEDLERQQKNRREANKMWRVYRLNLIARRVEVLNFDRATDIHMSWLPARERKAFEFATRDELTTYWRIRHYVRWRDRFSAHPTLIWRS